MKRLSGGCTLDCFDCCKFNVYVDHGEVIKVEGDKEHPYTKGFICPKGMAHLTRHSHPKRQYKPLLKVDGSWQEITFERALDIMAERLKNYRSKNDTKSVLYYEQYGSGSVLKSIGDVFFNFYGGCAKQKGGPCWSAGIAAQKQNFGDVRSHSLEDMKKSKTIIVWGKNPAETTIHTMQMIQEARKNGSYVIVIDPIRTATAKQADYYVQIKPDGDSALALAMAKRIIELGRTEEEYIERYVNGFLAYQEYLSNLDMQELCRKAGVSIETVDFLAERYTQKYSSILLGYGLQKYKYGGNTIHLIDALAALTGQIGESGGGVNYANRVYPDILDTDPYGSAEYAENQEFYVSRISSFLLQNKIKMAVIVKSNLMSQLPGLTELEEALKTVEFKVCMDQFLTDTAECCDLFIPTTTVFESEDLLYSSMTNPYLTYIEKAVLPKHPMMDEYAFFGELARRVGIREYPQVSKSVYLSKVIEPLREYEPEMSLDYLKEHYFTVHQGVAWEDKYFVTSSGKFELLFNQDALQEEEREVYSSGGLRLLTTHARDTLFSQHYMDKDGRSEAYVNIHEADTRRMKDGDLVTMRSLYGTISVTIRVDNTIGDGIVMMHVGWWKKHGNPNWILGSGISDIGGQVTYHENVVFLEKA